MLKHWPPLSTLRGFEAAARLGSFHKAADELHLTQSAISQQIRTLEAYLEQPLFFRSGRSVSLTDAGHDVLKSSEPIVGRIEQALVGALPAARAKAFVTNLRAIVAAFEPAKA